MAEYKEQSLKQIISFRLEKLNKIKKMGINPFPYEFKISHFSNDVKKNFKKLENKEVIISG